MGDADEGRTVVALHARPAVRMERPLPATAEPGSVHPVSGSLLSPLRFPELYVLTPDGSPVRMPALVSDTSFSAALSFARPGRYVIEVMGHGPNGPEVAALAWVQVGQVPPPPSEDIGAPGARPEEDLLEAIAALRRSRGLPPLVVQPALAEAAARYARSLASSGTLAHRLPGLGSAGDRVAASGYRFRRLAECLGEGTTPLQAFRAVASSPAHLLQLLDPAFRDLGVGVASAGSSWVVVQLLASPEGSPEASL
jgi:uncharacterized protein YkwD